jgi:retron-type reverse transcriptase
MKQFEEIFSDKQIISYLCKLRAKVAKQRNKKHLLHLLTGNQDFNYHSPTGSKSSYEIKYNDDLLTLFPPRKEWKKLGEDSRTTNLKGVKKKLNSVDKNLYSLIKTVNYNREKNPSKTWVKKLNEFILDIQQSIIDEHYSIATPFTYPKPKEKKAINKLLKGELNICRPLSLFHLKDKLIISFTNSWLTKLFDKFFEPCSLAFRAIPHKVVNHHTAIQEILDYKNKNLDIALWVSECDMQKFFDSVDHKVITTQFQNLLKQSISHSPHIDLTAATRIFNSYLKSYCFNLDVLPHNSNPSHWDEYKIPKGQYGWITDEIKDLKLYRDISKERIGIPQGGALSGLIANIVLDIADKKISTFCDNIFYVRFCDDMVIMHPDINMCSEAVELYVKTLTDCNLIPHKFSKTLIDKRLKKTQFQPELTLKSFWKGKSKGPYKWDCFSRQGHPWMGFVGYEIHFSGDIRVRKSSLKKEIDKQKKVIEEIRQAIATQQKVSGGTVTESAMKRLVGMSVSRVEMYNYETVVSEMCWKNGFQELNINKYSIKQLKKLDRNRSKLYYELVKDMEPFRITKEKKSEQGDDDDDTDVARRQLVAYDKAFSYYYHIVEKSKT